MSPSVKSPEKDILDQVKATVEAEVPEGTTVEVEEISIPADATPQEAAEAAKAFAAEPGKAAMGFRRQVPSVTRMVLYMSYGTPGGEFPSLPRAAVITEVDDPGNPESSVGLTVFNPSGYFFNQHVPWAPHSQAKGGTWDWPPFVAPIQWGAELKELDFTGGDGAEAPAEEDPDYSAVMPDEGEEVLDDFVAAADDAWLEDGK